MRRTRLERNPGAERRLGEGLAGSEAVFRLPSVKGPSITVGVDFRRDMALAADIVFRYLQRLGQSLGERLEELAEADDPKQAEVETATTPATAERPRAAFHLKSMFAAARVRPSRRTGGFRRRSPAPPAWPVDDRPSNG